MKRKGFIFASVPPIFTIAMILALLLLQSLGAFADTVATTSRSNASPRANHFNLVMLATAGFCEAESPRIRVHEFSGATIGWASESYAITSGSVTSATLRVLASNIIGSTTDQMEAIYLTPITYQASLTAVVEASKFGLYSMDLDPAIEEIVVVLAISPTLASSRTVVDLSFTKRR